MENITEWNQYFLVIAHCTEILRISNDSSLIKSVSGAYYSLYAEF